MSTRPSVAFFGSSLVSAYWNGACTYYRGIVRALDARGHQVTFLNDASVGRRQQADAHSIQVLAATAVEMYADIATTRHWLVATSPRSLKGQRHGRV